MILEKEVSLVANGYIVGYYRNKGYVVKTNDKFIVRVEDLQETSKFKILVQCDVCGKQKRLEYRRYLKSFNCGGYYACCSKCALEKARDTNLKIHGHIFPMQATREIWLENNIQKFGSKYPTQSQQVKDKTRITVEERYGVSNVSKVEEFKQNSRNTNMMKRGVPHHMKLQEFIDKIADTHHQNYGMYYTKTEEFRQIMSDSHNKRTTNFYHNILDNNDYEIISYKDLKFTINHNKCGYLFEIHRGQLYQRIHSFCEVCTHCYPISNHRSVKEQELINWISTSVGNIQYEVGNRIILNRKELDIYFEQENIAIEFNGLHWHSEHKKDSFYHLDKTINCLDKNIDLFHIFEDEWIFKQDIVKSIILKKLNLIEKVEIFEYSIKNVSIEDTLLFLSENYLSIVDIDIINNNIGLYVNNILISIICLNSDTCLIFCDKIFTCYTDSTKILFEHYLKTNSNLKITSLSEYRMFKSDSIYSDLGFVKGELQEPDYFWYKNINRYRHDDENIDLDKHSKIYGCGLQEWIYFGAK